MRNAKVKVVLLSAFVLLCLLSSLTIFSSQQASLFASAGKVVTCDTTDADGGDVQIIETGVVNTTLQAITAGTFSPGSGNKCGDTDPSDADTSIGTTMQCAVVPSCLVEINHVKVVAVALNNDGDYTIKVKNTTSGTVLITELMPQWQNLGIKPPVKGEFINVTGYIFFDTGHHTKLTSWEIHPITGWQAS